LLPVQAAWLGVLFAGYTVQRVASQLGLPDDGLQEVGAIAVPHPQPGTGSLVTAMPTCSPTW